MRDHQLRQFVIGVTLGVSGFGIAAVSLPHSFTAGSQIKSAEVNANFAALKTALETAAGINDGAISRAKLNVSGTVTDGKVLKAQGNDLVWADDNAAAGFNLPFTGSISSSSSAPIGFSVSSSDPAKTAIKGLGGNHGVVGDTLGTGGVGVLAANSAGGTALEVSGGIKVSGSNKPAFVHQASAANSFENFTCMSNALTNDRPNAVVIVTQNFNPNGSSGGVYNNSPIGVYYGNNPGNSLSFNKWCIFNQLTATSIPVNASFNVLVFNQ